jgi:hypothetical protein
MKIRIGNTIHYILPEEYEELVRVCKVFNLDIEVL